MQAEKGWPESERRYSFGEFEEVAAHALRTLTKDRPETSTVAREEKEAETTEEVTHVTEEEEVKARRIRRYQKMCADVDELRSKTSAHPCSLDW